MIHWLDRAIWLLLVVVALMMAASFAVSAVVTIAVVGTVCFAVIQLVSYYTRRF